MAPLLDLMTWAGLSHRVCSSIWVVGNLEKRVASTQDRIDLRSAGGFLDEESVICNHGFGTNLEKRGPVQYLTNFASKIKSPSHRCCLDQATVPLR